MRRVPKRCGRWCVGIFLARGAVIFGMVVLLLHGETLASDETAALLSGNVATFQLPIGEPVVMAAGDFNGDGYDDLFIVTEIKRPSLVFGVQGPRFLPSAEHEVRFFILSWWGEELGEPQLISAVAVPDQLVGLGRPLVADLDRDGHQDVAVLLIKSRIPEPPDLVNIATVKTELLIFWNQGDGSFVRNQLQVDLSPIPLTIPAITVADFNLDGLLDIVCLDSRGLRLLIFENQGGRNFADPIPVMLARADDECVPIPVNVCAARVDQARLGDDIVVSGPCHFDEGKFTHFVRVLSPCSTDCWQVSSLLLADVQMPNFEDALWDIAFKDINGDGHVDIIVLGLLHVADAQQLAPGTGVPFMDIYLLPGNGRGRFGPPQFLGWSEKGRFLFVELQPEREWSVAIVVLAELSIRPLARIVRISRDLLQVSSTTLCGRGYAVDGAVINRGASCELVLLASLDLESGVALVNVVRGWWQ